MPVLGWPEDKVRVGEIFDILLLDEHDKEVVTIETKHPSTGLVKRRESFSTKGYLSCRDSE